MIKNVHNKTTVTIERKVPIGYSANTLNKANSEFAANSFTLSNGIFCAKFNPNGPKTENHTIDANAGATETPSINSRTVLPLEILAIKVPTNGAHASHHAQ